MSTRKLERDLYLAQRTLGDVRAARNGTLLRRLVLRGYHRRLIAAARRGGIWGSR